MKVEFECPSHHRAGELVMTKNPQAVFHSCGCYLLITKTGDTIEVTELPDNPPGNIPL